MQFFAQNRVAGEPRLEANQAVPLKPPAMPDTARPRPGRTTNGVAVQIFILAGGLSSRMGRDKARLRLGGRALLTWVRAAARATGWPVRVVWRDAGPRRGPLGGVWTAFRRSRARRLVFLSCDQPFVTRALIRQVGRARGPVFTRSAEGAGFPFALDRDAQPAVAQALGEERFSLQAFAKRVRAKMLRPAKSSSAQLLNLNTPAELEAAQCRVETKSRR